MTAPKTAGGIRLGPGSPLLSPAGVRRQLEVSEFEIQKQLVELLVGKACGGQPRRMGDGMTGRYPELFDLYAIPNGGARGKAAAGRAKAEGAHASMCDLCLPAPRVPFAGLYVEVKRPGEYGRPDQRATAERLRARGYCVVEIQTVQEGLDAFIGYLELPSPIPSDETDLRLWRHELDRVYETLKPRRR